MPTVLTATTVASSCSSDSPSPATRKKENKEKKNRLVLCQLICTLYMECHCGVMVNADDSHPRGQRIDSLPLHQEKIFPKENVLGHYMETLCMGFIL